MVLITMDNASATILRDSTASNAAAVPASTTLSTLDISDPTPPSNFGFVVDSGVSVPPVASLADAPLLAVSAASANVVLGFLQTSYVGQNTELKKYIGELSNENFLNFYSYVESQPASSFKSRVSRWLKKQATVFNAKTLSVTIQQHKACVNNFNNVCGQVAGIKNRIKEAVDVLKKGVSNQYVNQTNDILDELAGIISDLMKNVDFKHIAKVNNALNEAVQELDANNTELFNCVESLKRLIDVIYRLRQIHSFSAKDFIDTAIAQLPAVPNVDHDLAAVAQKINSQASQDEDFCKSLRDQLDYHQNNGAGELTEIPYVLVNDVVMMNTQTTEQRYKEMFVIDQDAVMGSAVEAVIVPPIHGVKTGLPAVDKSLTSSRRAAATVKQYTLECLTVLQKVSDDLLNYSNHNTDQLKTAFVKALTGFGVAQTLFKNEDPVQVVNTITSYINSLQDKITQIVKMYQTYINNLTSKTQTIISEFIAAHGEFLNLQQYVIDITSQNNQNTQDLQQQNSQLIDRFQTFSTHMATLQHTITANKILNDSLEHQNQDLKHNITDLTAQLNLVKQKKCDVEQMSTKLFQEIEQQNKSELETMERLCIEKIASTNTERANVVVELTNTQKELKLCQTKIEQLTKENQTNGATINELNTKIIQLNTNQETSQMMISNQSEDYIVSQQRHVEQLEVYQHRMKELLSKNTEITFELNTLLEQQSELKRVYDESVAEVNRLNEHFKRVQAELEHKVALELTKKDDKIKEILKRLELNVNKNKTLEQTIVNLTPFQASYELSEQNLFELQERHAHTVTQINVLTERFEAAVNSNQTLTDEKNDLEDRLAEYDIKVNIMIKDHEKLMNQVTVQYDNAFVEVNKKLIKANNRQRPQPQPQIQSSTGVIDQNRHNLFTVSLKNKNKQVKKLNTEIVMLKRQLNHNNNQIRQGKNQLTLTKRCLTFMIQCHVTNNVLVTEHVAQLEGLIRANPTDLNLQMCLRFIVTQQETFNNLLRESQINIVEEEEEEEEEQEVDEEEEEEQEEEIEAEPLPPILPAPLLALDQPPVEASVVAAPRLISAEALIGAAVIPVRVKGELIDEFHRFYLNPIVIGADRWYKQKNKRKCYMSEFNADQIHMFVGPVNEVNVILTNEPPLSSLDRVTLTFCNKWETYEPFYAAFENPLQFIEQAHGAHNYPRVFVVTDQASLDYLERHVDKHLLLSYFVFVIVTDRGMWIYYPIYNLYLAPVADLHPCKKIADVFNQYNLDLLCVITNMSPELYVPFLMSKRFESHPIYFPNTDYNARANHMLEARVIPKPDFELNWYKKNDQEE
ncbi:protein ORF73 [Lake sturgeon herpesvirus]|nr:protein ORF73 [Lake sturgeon herpesvirus]